MSSGESLTARAITLHRRSIELDVADADMEIRVTVGVDDMIITGASARMHAFPHTECPGIVRAFAGLVGLGVARGYKREVQARFGGQEAAPTSSSWLEPSVPWSCSR